MRRGKCRSDKRKMIEEKLKAPPSQPEDGAPKILYGITFGPPVDNHRRSQKLRPPTPRTGHPS